MIDRMKSRAIGAIAAMAAAMCATAHAQQGADIEGIWQGKLAVSGIELRIVIHLDRSEEGELGGTMDSPDQGAKGIPLGGIEFSDGKLKFGIPAAGASYEGTLDDEGASIEGNFSQAGMTLPLKLSRSTEDDLPVLERPQEPKPPYPYRVEEVSYENPDEEGIRFAATLTLPEGEGPFAAVVMITGSGPQNRDEELLGHKPFWVIADYLTRRGIAVLRADDRGVGGSTGDISQATSADFAGDALAGVGFLKTHDEIDKEKIGLIGHSEGGIIAPIAAARSEEVAFIVLMAGTGVSGEEVIHLQAEEIGRAMGTSEEALAQSRKIREAAFALLEEEQDQEKLNERLGQMVEEILESASEAEREALEGQLDLLRRQSESLATPWMRYFLKYDPSETLRQVSCPVLVLNGEKDLQVIASQNLPPIVAALEEAGNRDYTIIKFPGLNHLFQPCETGAPSEYAQIETTIAPHVLEAMGDWIEARVGR